MTAAKLEREFNAGETIVDSGSATRELYLVRSGGVLLRPQDGAATRLLGPGEIFGELNAILGCPSPYTAQADSDAGVLVLDITTLNRLCAESPEFSFRLIAHLAQELAGTEADLNAREDKDARQPAIRKLVPVIFERRIGTDCPAPVAGTLRDLALSAELPMLEAYLCVQSLIERRYLQLVDDELSLLEPEALKDLVI